MNKRILAISDIHGCVDQLNQLLEKVQYNNREDQLILLGDYVDRGLKSRQTIDRVIELQKEGAITLRGNHDEMFVESMLMNQDDDQLSILWLNNGAFPTLESYVGFDFFEQGFSWEMYREAKTFVKEHYNHHIDFLKNLLPYYETEEYIFVHAGVLPPVSEIPLEKQVLDDLIWIRDEFHFFETGTEKMVIFGHTPTQFLHGDKANNNMWLDPIHSDKIGIDGGCSMRGQLNCLVMNGREISQVSIKK